MTMVTVSRNELEINVLKKLDPIMTELIDSAPFVAVYIYDLKQSIWQKVNYEGVLFIYKKVGIPAYNMVILNRLNDNNFYQSISKDFQLQVEESYIMYQNVNNNIIYAFWFHKKETCAKITSQIVKIMNIENSRDDFPIIEGNKVDIIAMLKNAEYRYEMEMHLPPKGYITDSFDYPSPSVLNFFVKANETCKKRGNPVLSPIPNNNNNLKSLIDNPRYNVESIEKQQRLLLNSDN